ncbi:MAG: T9SS type A sorting domain-containing protein [Bacteroidota bacterium]
MKNLLLVILIFIPFLSTAQTEFAPIGAEWHYKSFMGWLGEGVTHVQVVGDTLIDGQLCKKLHTKNRAGTNELNYNQFIFQRGDSVFMKLPHDYFLFKNKMMVGDTLNFPLLSTPNNKFRVEYDSTLILNGIQVKKYTLKQIETTFDFTVDIYDKFGPEYGFVDEWLGSPWDGNDHFLRCYQDDNFTQINLSNEDCDDGLTAASEKLKDKYLGVFPNPATEELNISLPVNFPPIQSIVFNNVSGAECFIDATNNQIDIRSLPAGFYIGRVRAGNEVYFIKFIKQ